MACTTSGGFFEVSASLRVVFRSENERLTRSILTLGYFCWNCLLSSSWASLIPVSVFWSQTVKVTSPTPEMSLDTGLVEVLAAGSSVVEPPGGAHAVAARPRAKVAARAPIVLVDLLICSPR